MTTHHRSLLPYKMGLFGLTVILWLGPGLTLIHACPMCSENLTSATNPPTDPSGATDTPTASPGGSLATGFYYSILLMLAVPFLMMTTFCGVLYVRIKNPAKPLGHRPPRQRATGSNR